MAKGLAFRDNPQRLTDLEYLKAILRVGHKMDQDYLLIQAGRLNIALPNFLQQEVKKGVVPDFPGVQALIRAKSAKRGVGRFLSLASCCCKVMVAG